MARIIGEDGPRTWNVGTGTVGTIPQPARSSEATRSSVTDTFGSARVAHGRASGTSGDPPAAIKTPALDYYRQRYDDFVQRNPGKTPPSYYLEYGQKYLEKFSALGQKDLSPSGLAWRDRTLKTLQDAIEKKRMEDPEGFAKLEQNDAAFKAFAYGTHPDAYLKGGLLKLPAHDLLKIASTPELKDLFTPDGLKQIWSVLRQVSPRDVGDIAWATIQEELQRLPHFEWPHIELPHIHLPPIELPRLPSFPIPQLPFRL